MNKLPFTAVIFMEEIVGGGMTLSIVGVIDGTGLIRTSGVETSGIEDSEGDACAVMDG
jgi:hypothetical protein